LTALTTLASAGLLLLASLASTTLTTLASAGLLLLASLASTALTTLASGFLLATLAFIVVWHWISPLKILVS
jgi:hypothetical protein